MNRRQFLKDSAALANCAALADVARGVPAAPCPVTLLPMPDYGRDVSKEIAAVMSADGLRLKGKKVLLKPNFVEAHPERPINTHVAVIANAALACLRLGAAEVVVGEASGHRRDPWFSVLNPSLRDVLDREVRRIDLNHGDVVSITNKGRRTGLPVFYVARPVAEADVLISMPKMKTHHWMGVTLCLKNLSYGSISNTSRLHAIWTKSVAEPCAFPVLRDKVVLNIVDGLQACYDGGPGANPKFIYDANLMLFGTDPVAVDLIGHELMTQERIGRGIQQFEDKARREFLDIAASLGLGTATREAVILKELSLA